MLVCFDFFYTVLRNRPFAPLSLYSKTRIAMHHGSFVPLDVRHSFPPKTKILYKSFASPTFWQNFSFIVFVDVLKFQKTYQAVRFLSSIEQLRAIWKDGQYLNQSDFFCKITPKTSKLIPLGSFSRLLCPF